MTDTSHATSPIATDADRLERTLGAAFVAFDLVDTTVSIVADTHRRERARWRRVLNATPAAPVAGPAAAVHTVATEPTFATIRAVSRGLRGLTELALRSSPARRRLAGPASAGPPLSASAVGSAAWWADQAEANLNAFWGDLLARRGNGLATATTFRDRGRSVSAHALSERLPPGPIVVFVHGLAASEWCWSAGADVHWGNAEETFGARLHADFGAIPVYVRYNSGRPIRDTGAELAGILEALHRGFGDAPRTIALVGHSMGGLVARAALRHAERAAHTWLAHCSDVVSIGSPHRGAPLAKAASLASRLLGAVDLPATRIGARLIESRSSGVRDLDHGEAERAALPDHIAAHAIGATVTRRPEHPVGRAVGDVMVRVTSALPSGEAFANQLLVTGLGHIAITNHPAVYDALRTMLEPSLTPSR